MSSAYPAVGSPEFETAFAELMQKMGWDGKMRLPTPKDNFPCSFIDKLREAIPDFSYIESRGWFHRDVQLQNKLHHAVNIGLGDKICVTHEDLHEHLDELIAMQYAS